ncbi:TPA: hypothetical protein ACX3KA_004202 [Raoultella ornithinolytica]
MKASGGTEFIPGITINNVPFGVLPDDGFMMQFRLSLKILESVLITKM